MVVSYLEFSAPHLQAHEAFQQASVLILGEVNGLTLPVTIQFLELMISDEMRRYHYVRLSEAHK